MEDSPKKPIGKKDSEVKTDPAAMVAVVSGALAITGGICAFQGKMAESVGEAKQLVIETIERATSYESCPTTSAALEDEKIGAVSETIKARAAKGWGNAVAATGLAVAGAATSRVRKKSRKNDEKVEPTQKS